MMKDLSFNFSSRVFEVVKRISKGGFLSYKEVAKRAGNPKAYRMVAKLMAKNQNLKVSCNRVIKNNNEKDAREYLAKLGE